MKPGIQHLAWQQHSHDHANPSPAWQRPKGRPPLLSDFFWGFPPSAEARPQRETRDKTPLDDLSG